MHQQWSPDLLESQSAPFFISGGCNSNRIIHIHTPVRVDWKCAHKTNHDLSDRSRAHTHGRIASAGSARTLPTRLRTAMASRSPPASGKHALGTAQNSPRHTNGTGKAHRHSAVEPPFRRSELPHLKRRIQGIRTRPGYNWAAAVHAYKAFRVCCVHEEAVHAWASIPVST
jgi:hypothetical protein